MNMSNLSRRRFLSSASCVGVTGTLIGASSLSTISAVEKKQESVNSKTAAAETTFSLDGRNVKFYSSSVSEPVRILQITDAHLFLDDERGKAYRENSDRMAHAYNVTRHYQTGQETNPIKALKEIAESIPEKKVDAIVMTGDIVSFPSAAGVDYVKQCLDPLNIPYYYVSGNHDWHFEGLPGSEKDLRAEWIEKRLKNLYPRGVNPLAYSVKVKGVKLILIDDSIYEILPEQLDFLRKELAQQDPSLLFMHIPLYAPGRPVSFGVGNPNWKAANDGNYEIERRPRWPEKGHSETTYAFRSEILKASNLMGVFTGHIHRQSLDVCEGKPLHVAPASNDGSTLTIEILPLS